MDEDDNGKFRLQRVKGRSKVNKQIKNDFIVCVLICLSAYKSGYLYVCMCNLPVDGGWSDWSSWSECTAVCGGTRQQRQRSCTAPLPRTTGGTCPGDDIEYNFCSIGTTKIMNCQNGINKCCLM